MDFSSPKIFSGNKHNPSKFYCHHCCEDMQISNMSWIIFIEIEELQGKYGTTAILTL
jgi:hypothetical protein